MDFATWYMKTVGIPLEEAKARGVADLELMEQCFVESKAAERRRWRVACETIAGDLRNHDMVRLGAAKCMDAGLKA